MITLSFGDVFQYNNKEYIFLAETEDILYAARILNPNKSTILKRTYESAVKRNSPLVETNAAYSFVVLQTKEFKERAASFFDTGNERFDDYEYISLNVTLCREDLLEIKEEITKKKCISRTLKELVKDIEI